ncbi:nucleotide pyrophosphohydrolase [uncultured Microbulbifer sp.]|uniref:nucleotide pyrophosphohydrolase n=1 Tax=uncultured Microbulbifer sp. TaxID=348147 RepID=UPI0025F40226|nr:nucleotide pyrophosphohydrolase [uncultured Microbulbifer sp.]
MEFDRLARDKGWQQLHTPKNLAMALGVEVAELHRHLQWRSDAEIAQLMVSDAGAEVAAELADIQMYLIKLSASLGVDLDRAVADKIVENRRR